MKMIWALIYICTSCTIASCTIVHANNNMLATLTIAVSTDLGIARAAGQRTSDELSWPTNSAYRYSLHGLRLGQFIWYRCARMG